MTMTPELNLFSTINLIGVAQAVFWAMVLIGMRRNNQTANLLLAVFLLSLAAGVLIGTLESTGYIRMAPHLAEVATPLMFIYPPLFYLYVRSLTARRFSFRRDAYHFVPSVVCVLYLMPVYLLPAREKLELLRTETPGDNPLLAGAVLLVEMIYIALTLAALQRHTRSVRDSYSSTDRVNLLWLRNLVFGFLMVTAVYFVFLFGEWQLLSGAVAPASVTVFVYVMGYYAVRQPEIFSYSGNGGRKYQKSGLTDERAGRLLHKLTHFMEQDKPHLEPALTLGDLAEMLAISPNHLSQLLNERLQQTFFDFVNGYRVREAQHGLSDPAKRHLTILAIAYEVGFNSKSSFNTAFKKHLGMTPSQFRNAPSTSL